MKLQELYPDVINLTEALNTKVDVTWDVTPDGKNGTFVLDEDKFVIRFQRLDIDDFNVINISFYIWDGVEWSIKMTNKHKSSRIIGAIYNALKDGFNNVVYDAVVFGARSEQDKRMRIYNFLASLFIKKLGNFIENIPGPHGSLYTIVLTKSVSDNYSHEEIMELAQPYLNKEI